MTRLITALSVVLFAIAPAAGAQESNSRTRIAFLGAQLCRPTGTFSTRSARGCASTAMWTGGTHDRNAMGRRPKRTLSGLDRRTWPPRRRSWRARHRRGGPCRAGRRHRPAHLVLVDQPRLTLGDLPGGGAPAGHAEPEYGHPGDGERRRGCAGRSHRQVVLTVQGVNRLAPLVAGGRSSISPGDPRGGELHHQRQLSGDTFGPTSRAAARRRAHHHETVSVESSAKPSKPGQGDDVHRERVGWPLQRNSASGCVWSLSSPTAPRRPHQRRQRHGTAVFGPVTSLAAGPQRYRVARRRIERPEQLGIDDATGLRGPLVAVRRKTRPRTVADRAGVATSVSVVPSSARGDAPSFRIGGGRSRRVFPAAA